MVRRPVSIAVSVRFPNRKVHREQSQVRQSLPRLCVLRTQQEIEQIASLLRSRRRPSRGDDTFNFSEPALLKAPALVKSEGKSVVAFCQPVEQVRPSGARDILAREMAERLALAAFRHRE